MHPTSPPVRPKHLSRWLCLIGLVAGCMREAGEIGVVQSEHVLRPLDLAWTFASAVDNDPDDRATYQRNVALARLDGGDLRMALTQGRLIGDWNRGLVLARAAEEVARRGDASAAQALLLEADTVAGSAGESWQADRIRLAAGNTVVLIGATNGLAWLEGRYGNSPEYGGHMAAVRALRKARDGRWTEAFAELDAIPATNAFDSVAWKAKGYGLLAQEASASSQDLATNALSRMWRAAGHVPGPLGIELRLEAVGSAIREGASAFAKARLRELDEGLATGDGPPHIVLPLKLRMAELLARAGDATRANDIAEELLPACRADVMPIECPALLAAAGEALALAGARSVAEAVFEEAVQSAAALRNRRPRCLALCDIALRLEASGLPDGAPLDVLRRTASALEGR